MNKKQKIGIIIGVILIAFAVFYLQTVNSVLKTPGEIEPYFTDYPSQCAYFLNAAGLYYTKCYNKREECENIRAACSECPEEYELDIPLDPCYIYPFLEEDEVCKGLEECQDAAEALCRQATYYHDMYVRCVYWTDPTRRYDPSNPFARPLY